MSNPEAVVGQTEASSEQSGKEAALDLNALKEEIKNEFYLNPHRMVIRRRELSSCELQALTRFAQLFELDVTARVWRWDGHQRLGVNDVGPNDAVLISISERF